MPTLPKPTPKDSDKPTGAKSGRTGQKSKPTGKKKPHGTPPKTAKAKPELLNVPVPSEGELAAISETLSEADRKLFEILLDRLTTESGSREVARLWLVTPSPEFSTVPLDEVRNGHVTALLKFVESRYGASPPYA